MRKSIYTYAMLLAMPVIAMMTSCEPSALEPEQVLQLEGEQLEEALKNDNPEGYTIYNFNDLLDKFMTEPGNFLSDSSQYRTRTHYGNLYLFSVDTLPTNGPGIYIRGRVGTDDYGGNFYKSLVLQQVNDWMDNEKPIEQQCLRVSVDLGSANGQYPQGQEILIRCNGLAIGRYANEPQLCIPTYNNNIYANSASEKVGWAAGRIPSSVFRKVTFLLGTPDKGKLVFEKMTLAQLKAKYTNDAMSKDVVAARKIDGRLVKITGVHFNGKCNNNGDMVSLVKYDPETNEGNPEVKDSYAAVFAPTTGNIGYPQSRYVEDDDKNKILIGASEYARYAYYYIPSKKHVGSITGVLGYYMDNPKYAPDATNWSITPCNLGDILPECQREGMNLRWVPTEWKAGVPQPEDD